MQDVNRLKLVLVEQKKTSKWLSEELGVNPSTVSKCFTNSSQPDIETLAKIAKLLNYHRDITEKGLRIYLQNDKIGIHNLDNDKKTMPSFDRVVTSDKYVFVEVNNRWGILAMDLSLIASPMYNEIYPIKLTDRKKPLNQHSFLVEKYN